MKVKQMILTIISTIIFCTDAVFGLSCYQCAIACANTTTINCGKDGICMTQKLASGYILDCSDMNYCKSMKDVTCCAKDLCNTLPPPDGAEEAPASTIASKLAQTTTKPQQRPLTVKHRNNPNGSNTFKHSISLLIVSMIAALKI